MPQLDGLRFFAFLLIFSLHLGLWHRRDLEPAVRFFVDRGWIGVELFFCLSAFLFFRLMGEEWRATGRIDVAKFAMRRVLRIYPLTTLYAFLMVLIFSNQARGWENLVPIAFCFDNIVAWTRGFNPIRYTGHLWTLSAEFQLYAVIPFVFLLSRRIGERRFLVVLLALGICGIAARYVLVGAGTHLPVVWVTPPLHPEATLLGMAAGLPLALRLNPRHVGAAAALSAIAFLIIPTGYHRGNHLMWIYPVAAVLCASLVWLAAQGRLRPLATRVMVYLGQRSFGLYIFHVLAINLSAEILSGLRLPTTLAVQFAVALVLCVGLAVASYRFLEMPFLQAKLQFELVPGRSP